MGTGALFFLCQKGVEGALPAGGRVTDVSDRIFCHLIPPACPGGTGGLAGVSLCFFRSLFDLGFAVRVWLDVSRDRV